MTKAKRALAAVAGLVLTAASLTGCQWLVDHTPLPTPAPPTTSATPPETAQERLMRLDKEAAVKAYSVATAEGVRLAMSGGALKPTTILDDNTAGRYLSTQMNGLKGLKEDGLRTDRRPVDSVTADGGWSPTELGLTACEDASKVRLLDKSGHEVLKDRPRMFVQTITVKKIDGRWKLYDLRSKIVKTFAHEDGCSL